jgi:hypothetical protein
MSEAGIPLNRNREPGTPPYKYDPVLDRLNRREAKLMRLRLAAHLSERSGMELTVRALLTFFACVAVVAAGLASLIWLIWR